MKDIIISNQFQAINNKLQAVCDNLNAYRFARAACGLWLVACCFPTFSQQDPIYAQYINNAFAINPAFAGSNNMFNATIQYRTQWAGLDANPTTMNFNSHMSVNNNKVGVGIQVVQDKIGENTNTEFNAVYAYKLKLNDATLSFGLQAGLARYANDLSRLNIFDQGDLAFLPFTETKFNFGAGAFLKSDRYVIGLSVPRLVPASVSQGGQAIQLASQNFYLFGSHVFLLSEKIHLKPSMLLRTTKNTPVSIDLNASATFKELYIAGIFTRNFQTYGLLLQMLYKNWRLGYVIELPGSSTSSLNFVSHEITLGLSMGVFTYHDQALNKTF
jgi:type IX secretion system PorP/SprF family membrane protein